MNSTFQFKHIPSNAIVGCEGTALTPQERDLLKDMRPLGLILFARNIQHPEQLKALTDDFKDITLNPDALILIDQEGGRVSRLPSEHWRIPPSPTVFAKLYEVDRLRAIEACKINYQLIGLDLKRAGISVNCAPMLDIPQANASTVVTDRALGSSPDAVIDLARATIEGLQLCAVEPVIKHGPGHGRGTVDSHKALPTVDATLDALAQWDFLPFEAFKHQSMLMTAHILYSHIDATHPGTFSKQVINDVLRKQIGFGGLIMTDDIDMHALSGSTASRAQNALNAGCDVVLQCSGNFADLTALESVVSPLSGDALTRARVAAGKASTPLAHDSTANEEALLNKLNTLLKTT
ncbi:beta-N-acetylhexosaminidase [Glaciecola siphonariae]|uniref:beta-N-acetylhexosaminidase n=1 Tax=Glaciecola siphonariae TaxID=521012 RepID=A0ABV9LYY6_9ALTE